LTYGNVLSNVISLSVADTSPGIFTPLTLLSGLLPLPVGSGSTRNDDGTPNSIGNPAKAGSTILFYATGEGVLSPQPATGAITTDLPASAPVPRNPISLKVGGQAVTKLIYAEASGLFSGILQIKAEIPATVPSGPQPLDLAIGTASNSGQSIVVVVG
jgi:uncharacterized protein (TIGR03437 family)